MRHILFFAGYHMQVFALSRSRVVDCHVFEPDTTGFEDFKNHVQQHIRKPTHLLVDLIEEDFHLDSVPHVIGSDRKKLYQRLLNKYLRNAEHRFIRVQGRERAGRKDDQVLIAGIGNSERLKPWLNILDASKVALAGIHSLPLLAEKALKNLDIGDQPTLLMTQQVAASYRHSLYKHGRLKISRLVQALGDEQESEAAVTLREIDKTRRFFENQRMIENGENLRLHLVGSAPFIQALQGEVAKQGQQNLLAQLHFHTLPEEQDFAEVLFVELLASQRWPKNHYAHSQNLRVYYHKLASHSLLALALVLFVAALFGTGYFVRLEAQERKAVPELTAQARYFREHYDAQTGELAELGVEAADVAYSVEALERLEQRYAQTPQQFLIALSQASKDFPKVNYQIVKWQLEEVTATQGHRDGDASTVGRFRAEVDGTLPGFADSPSKAVQEVNSLMSKLREYPGFESISASKMPFDIASNSQFTMDSSVAQPRSEQAAFSLLIKGRLP